MGLLPTVIRKKKREKFKFRFNFWRETKLAYTPGRTVGVIYECLSWHTKRPVTAIVQIRKAKDTAEVTICDHNEDIGTFVSFLLPEFATGVYLEHLREYKPEQIQFYYRRTLDFGLIEWGNHRVQMTWDKNNCYFKNAELGKWMRDFEGENAEIKEEDKIFIDKVCRQAQSGAAAYLKDLEDKGLLTERKKELYKCYRDYFLDHKSEMYRYNLRSNRLFIKYENGGFSKV